MCAQLLAALFANKLKRDPQQDRHDEYEDDHFASRQQDRFTLDDVAG
jgi:hypothetical protein